MNKNIQKTIEDNGSDDRFPHLHVLIILIAAQHFKVLFHVDFAHVLIFPLKMAFIAMGAVCHSCLHFKKPVIILDRGQVAIKTNVDVFYLNVTWPAFDGKAVPPVSLTASLPLKNGAWKTSLSYWDSVTVQGRAVKLWGGYPNALRSVSLLERVLRWDTISLPCWWMTVPFPKMPSNVFGKVLLRIRRCQRCAN